MGQLVGLYWGFFVIGGLVLGLFLWSIFLLQKTIYVY